MENEKRRVKSCNMCGAPVGHPHIPALMWRDIESAPKDGTKIDLYTFNGREPDCKWHRDEWVYYGIDMFDSWGWVKLGQKATHWMPVPEAPNKDTIWKEEL